MPVKTNRDLDAMDVSTFKVLLHFMCWCGGQIEMEATRFPGTHERFFQERIVVKREGVHFINKEDIKTMVKTEELVCGG
jgi:hypothetical protein